VEKISLKRPFLIKNIGLWLDWLGKYTIFNSTAPYFFTKPSGLGFWTNCSVLLCSAQLSLHSMLRILYYRPCTHIFVALILFVHCTHSVLKHCALRLHVRSAHYWLAIIFVSHRVHSVFALLIPSCTLLYLFPIHVHSICIRCAHRIRVPIRNHAYHMCGT
jgi:hypothetical protein